ncbi:MAG: riboflavin biosynthesis protein RibF [Planctomycetes bacterium]|nr:riboflavin biosynthesis protein RibF [Planctomycetota bacterium]
MPYRGQTFASFAEFRDRGGRLRELRPVVSVGSFDGVHLGHQYLLNELVEWARREHCPAVVVTFRQHPRAVMLGRDMPSLNSPEQKLRLLFKSGLDAVVMVDFDESVRNLSAQRFLVDVIRGDLNARGMLVGFNNRIGKDGEGTFERLRDLGTQHGVEVRPSDPVTVSGQAMSSSAIRNHVAAGDFLWARKLLGRPYSIGGVVQHGDKRGRAIGFPTANLPLEGLAYPPTGVYGVRVKVDGTWHTGAANIGTRPTVDPSRRTPLLEVHLLDFDGDLYGRELEVEFLFAVRPERKFAGLDELKAQLARDVAEIRDRAAQEEYQ